MTRRSFPVRPMLVALAAGLCASLTVTISAAAQPAAAPAPQPAPSAKKPVKTVDDLPRHTYKIEGKASDFIVSDAPFKAFVKQVKADAEADLAGYDIQDPTTLQEYYTLLQQIAMLEGRGADALAMIEKVRALEAKESKKLMTGQVLGSMIDAKKAAGSDEAKFNAAFKDNLNKRVSALPWDVVREEVVRAKGRTELVSRELIVGQLKAALDPVVENAGGEISGDLARGLVGAKTTIDVILPLQPMIGEVYSAIIDSRKTVAKDIWAERNVALAASEAGTPVVAAVWDSGVDIDLFKTQQWTNAKETVNGKDDDGNGFVDDVHGIAWDLDSKAVTELLHPLGDLRSEKSLVTAHTKGLGDLQSGVDSSEASDLKKYLKSLKADEVNNFLEDLGLFGNYSHGTHVAGIAADGNPFIRLLAARITFDFRTIPTHTPTVERAMADAAAVKKTVEYFKANGVRVVNMSWGGSRQSIEEELEKKGWGKDPEERADLSRKLFKIQRDALEEAFKSAPEILFIAAAGNADSNNEFGEFVPSGLNLPNLVTVGAVDQSGKPTGFTSFGSNVHLYANGFEVESYIPGGQRLKFNGTSMAAPQVMNLAAKILAVNPKLTVAQVIDIITKGADPMQGSKDNAQRLIINPKKSLELAKKAK